jgi:hypothetical protein
MAATVRSAGGVSRIRGRCDVTQPIVVENENDGTTDITVTANGLVIAVVANDDGTVYIEAYAEDRSSRAIVAHALIDAYQTTHPSLTLEAIPSRRTT